MSRLNAFEEFIKYGVVKKVSVNRERAKSLIIESDRKMRILKEHLDKMGVRNDNANDYVEYCYDTIMYLLRAKLYLDGYSASGQGAHEAEVSYLSKLGFSVKDVTFADQMRYFRNGILYYGTSLDKEYAEKVVEFTQRIYPKLKSMVS
jgi:hypothetical protein